MRRQKMDLTSNAIKLHMQKYDLGGFFGVLCKPTSFGNSGINETVNNLLPWAGKAIEIGQNCS